MMDAIDWQSGGRKLSSTLTAAAGQASRALIDGEVSTNWLRNSSET